VVLLRTDALFPRNQRRMKKKKVSKYTKRRVPFMVEVAHFRGRAGNPSFSD